MRQEVLNLITWFCTKTMLSKKKLILYKLLTLYMFYLLNKFIVLFYIIPKLVVEHLINRKSFFFWLKSVFLVNEMLKSCQTLSNIDLF